MRLHSKLALFTLMLSLSAGAPRAATLGEAIDAASAAQFAALSDVPAMQLGLLHEISSLFEARRAGTIDAAVADEAIAMRLHGLVSSGALPRRADTEAWSVLLFLHGKVIAEELQPLVGRSESREFETLGRAFSAYLERLGEALPRPRAGADGPDHDCLTLYIECLVFASNERTWGRRSSVGIDCYLDFIACLGGVAGSIPSLPVLNHP